jgi:hypothetical protein
MRLNIRAAALAAGVLWGVAVLAVALANRIWPEYGGAFLQAAASLYPGYKASGSLGDAIAGFLYALVDGLLCGLVFAWLYNLFAGAPAKAGDDVKRKAGVDYPTIEPKA